MRQLLSFVLFVALAGCNQANLEQENAELRHENDLLEKQLAETRRILNETRAVLLSLDGVKKDLEIDKRLGRLEFVRAKKLYKEAYVIKETNAERAMQNLRKVMALLPAEHRYHEKARSLLVRLGGSESLPDPESPPAMDGEGQTAVELRQLGIAAYRRNDFTEALALYRSALKKNPKEFEIYRLMGSAYARKGNRKQAYERYRQYVRLCPKCPHSPAIEKILADYEAENNPGGGCWGCTHGGPPGWNMWLSILWIWILAVYAIRRLRKQSDR